MIVIIKKILKRKQRYKGYKTTKGAGVGGMASSGIAILNKVNIRTKI